MPTGDLASSRRASKVDVNHEGRLVKSCSPPTCVAYLNDEGEGKEEDEEEDEAGTGTESDEVVTVAVPSPITTVVVRLLLSLLLLVVSCATSETKFFSGSSRP